MKWKRHRPEQIIRKHRGADRMLSEGKDIAAPMFRPCGVGSLSAVLIAFTCLTAVRLTTRHRYGT